MTKREKVLEGLSKCELYGQTLQQCLERECPYVEQRGETGECVRFLHGDAVELMKEREAKPYGAFIEFPYRTGELTGYTAIVEQMMDIGILKVEKQETPMLTRFNWAIKAVKWDD